MTRKALTVLAFLVAAGSAQSQTLKVDVFINDGSTFWIDAVANGNASIDASDNVTITSIPTDGTSFRVYYTGGLSDLGEIRHNVDEPTIICISPDVGAVAGKSADGSHCAVAAKPANAGRAAANAKRVGLCTAGAATGNGFEAISSVPKDRVATNPQPPILRRPAARRAAGRGWLSSRSARIRPAPSC